MPRRRALRGADQVERFVVDRSSKIRMKRISQDHEDILRTIETVIVARLRADRSLDDRSADLALTALILGDDPADHAINRLARAIAGSRPPGDTPDDALWFDCLRVVQESIRRHSGLGPGQVDYLAYAEGFIDSSPDDPDRRR